MIRVDDNKKVEMEEMACFFKQKLDFIAVAKKRRVRAHASTVLFNYIVEHFDAFLTHFSSNRTLMNVIYEKCRVFANEPKLQKYTKLVNVCKALCSKLEDVLTMYDLLKKTQ